MRICDPKTIAQWLKYTWCVFEYTESTCLSGKSPECLAIPNQAVEYYMKAINPQKARAHSRKGAVFNKLRRYEEAVQVCDQSHADHIGAFHTKGNSPGYLGYPVDQG